MTSSTIDEQEVRRRYAAGESLRVIASDLGVSVDTVRARIPERRPTGRPERGDVDTAEIIRLHDEEGLSWRKIGAQLGISHTAASRRYAAHSTTA